MIFPQTRRECLNKSREFKILLRGYETYSSAVTLRQIYSRMVTFPKSDASWHRHPALSCAIQLDLLQL